MCSAALGRRSVAAVLGGGPRRAGAVGVCGQPEPPASCFNAIRATRFVSITASLHLPLHPSPACLKPAPALARLHRARVPCWAPTPPQKVPTRGEKSSSRWLWAPVRPPSLLQGQFASLDPQQPVAASLCMHQVALPGWCSFSARNWRIAAAPKHAPGHPLQRLLVSSSRM